MRSALLTGGVATVATGISVSGGVLSTASPTAAPAVAGDLVDANPSHVSHNAAHAATALSDRSSGVSRSSGDRRAEADRLKQAALSNAGGVARTSVEKINSEDPRELARALMPEYGLKTSEFGCLDRIWTQESKWNVHADNPSSSAYGIPQALPGSKMASAGPDWANSAETQIRWGLGYIQQRYGSACSAWGFKAGHGWY
ncbi:lytic transglycosylase domain-containing protein [Nocardioides mangrovicus]|uniref:Lytic transglycosylase domain-containing protein n=1 Tax=Nocardioides mangrovicus TaxID=2478913 RepID=A0A3L8P7Z4_9ACTN|nr:lytic transglycosylase domain-containing protein [Nocardioides mangrovicus]RLV50759.1 lytic transglycosylase domain-containing protein [Nocardioides mangrovicus]